MTDKEQKKAAAAFAKDWAGKGNEDQDTVKFWIGFIRRIWGIEDAENYIDSEKRVKYEGHTTKIDIYIPNTRVLIEQKSLGVDLDKPERRHGEMLTPFKQAEQYSQKLKLSEKARYIIVSNFETFRIYNLDQDGFESTYEEIKLCDLEKEYHRFGFMIDSEKKLLQREIELSDSAAKLIGKIYKAILKQYKDPDSDEVKKALNVLCVRLVFCYYAEDAGLFDTHEMFGEYLAKFPVQDVNTKLEELFEVLNTKVEDRYHYLDKDLAAFPYVNGGLFEAKTESIPEFNDEIIDLLVNEASRKFDWSGISPTIFGAMFESTLDPDPKRNNGMYYTSVENIHKVIDPLFLDELKAEFQSVVDSHVSKAQKMQALEDFRDKLAELNFLDPACGSGNFLTETYLSLRTLENEVLSERIKLESGSDLQTTIATTANAVKISIGQFYGIEIDDFAVSVAKTAMWIAEAQMLHRTEKIMKQELVFLPLKSYTNIKEGNALRMDWETVVPKDRLNYIMGNPPFVGSSRLSDDQIKDRDIIFNGQGGELDYVACWYKKAADYIESYNIRCAFVSTNSICQGQQVLPLWEPLCETGIKIDFAYRTFRWDSEAQETAKVSCIIIGFSRSGSKGCLLFDKDKSIKTNHINGYLLSAPDIFIQKRRTPLSDVPEAIYGIKPADHGYLILDDEEKQSMIKNDPEAEKWIKPFITAKEYINGIPRWCLWLKDITPEELSQRKEIKKRVDACQKWREKQVETGDAYKLKETPTLMRPNNKFKGGSFIVLPRHTGENRRYIPFGFSNDGDIPGDSISLIPNADKYHFGVLISRIHVLWTLAICGRLKGDPRYASDIVYNNFPWPNPTDKQKEEIIESAQMILDARAKYPDSSLAKLYGKSTMPPELTKAHKANDKAVMKAYGFKPDMTESEIVAELMKMYQKLTGGK